MKTHRIITVGILSVSFLYGDVAHAGGDDEREIKNMTLDISSGREMQIREQSMCDGEGEAEVEWDEDDNEFEIEGEFEGLPYRQTFCYDYDPTSDYNDYPLCVEGDDGQGTIGVWQMWFVGHFFTKTSTFYYDSTSGDLLYNEYDIPSGGLDPNAIPVVLPVVQMVCSDFFESDSNGDSEIEIETTYDAILDVAGTGGVFVTIVPVNLNTADIDVYYTDYLEGNAGLPVSEAMNGDEIRANIAAAEANEEACEDCEDACNGNQACLDTCAATAECTSLPAFIVATSYEPLPKPDYLKARDNLMIGFGGAYPERFAPRSPTPSGVGACETFQYPDPF